jgi:MATE family multidrug resistance protein
MTNNQEVLASAADYLPWLLIVPLLSCTAFILDGIFIGATASKAIRDTMLLSAASFFITFYTLENQMGLQALYLAYMIHLVVRTVMMSFLMKRKVLSKALI